MTDGLDFENEAAFDLHYWAHLDEKNITAEIQGLTSRIKNTAELLEGMAYRANFDSTEHAYNALMTEDLGTSGFVYLFTENNKAFFGEKAAAGTPSWYKDLLPEVKKSYDMAKSIYAEAASLVKPMLSLQKIMGLIPLEKTYRYQLTTLGFYDGGYDEKLFETMNNDVKEICEFFEKKWSLFNGRTSGPDRKSKLWDHKREVMTLRCADRFTDDGNGHYSTEQGFETDLYIIDKYTMRLSILGNIEDPLQEVMKGCIKATGEIGEAMEIIGSRLFIDLINSLLDLKNTLYNYADLHISIYNNYKNRIDDAPFCFVKKALPAYSLNKGKFGFKHPTEDPWYTGSEYKSLYESAARALTKHCEEYLKQAQS